MCRGGYPYLPCGGCEGCMKKFGLNSWLRVEPAVNSKEMVVPITNTGKVPEAQRSELCVMAGEGVAER